MTRPLSGIATARLMLRAHELRTEAIWRRLTMVDPDPGELEAMARQEAAMGDDAAPPAPDPEPKAPKATPTVELRGRETELNRWLFDVWQTEGQPGGSAFFRRLKGYQGKPGSPILQWFAAGKKAGIEWQTCAGATGEWSKKTILNKVSTFRKRPLQ